MLTVLVDYDSGNLHSAEKAFQRMALEFHLEEGLEHQLHCVGHKHLGQASLPLFLMIHHGSDLLKADAV
jgi:hypothetical protein